MSEGIQHPLSLQEATKLINQYADSDETDWVYSQHADERGDQRNICEDWIERTLSEGRVVSVREHKFPNGKVQYRYKVELVDNYGESVVITVIPKRYTLVIITVW